MRTLRTREKRMLALLGVAACLFAFDVARRAFRPTAVIETEHYRIESSAPAAAARATGEVAEFVYAAYDGFLRELGLAPVPHGKLQMRLYASREEFRRVNRITDWAEAFYRRPVCHQYFDPAEPNPYHWMVHEAAHQLNAEVAGLVLPQWLNEGIADCFGTSRIDGGRLALGEPDTNTYPVWWMALLATSGDLEDDKRNGSVIPLRAIVGGTGGPDLDAAFNLYYLHWWTLVRHLLREHPKQLGAVMRSKGDLAAFERHFGPIDELEREWYASLPKLKESVERENTPPVRLGAPRNEPRS